MTTKTRNDVELKDDVLAELKWEPSVQESQIGVIAKDGIVTLTGAVEFCATKSAAEQATLRVAGVKALANELEIKMPGSLERTDAELASAAVNALQWHVFVPRDSVKLAVENGWLTLKGQLDWQYQKDAAFDALHHLLGVKGVINEITITPRVTPADVKQRIVAAMERNALLDSKPITVDVQGGRVVLRGTVHSWAEKEEARAAASLAPGVTHVDNQIRIEF